MKIVDTKKGKTNATPGVRVNRTGRRSFTLEYKLGVVKQCCESGVSVAAIALSHRLNANLVRRWVVRHQRKLIDAPSPSQAALLPVILEATASAAQDRSTSATTKSPPVGGSLIEIEFYGARIRLRGGIDAEALRTVLDVLGAR